MQAINITNTTNATQLPEYSYDPIVNALHIQRAQEQDRFAGNIDAWFTDLLTKQAQRLSKQTTRIN